MKANHLHGNDTQLTCALLSSPVFLCVLLCVHAGPYRLVLSSDEEVFGGWRNLSKETDGEHQTQGVSHGTAGQH